MGSESGGCIAWVWITMVTWWNLRLPLEWLYIWPAGSWGVRGRWRKVWGGKGPYPGASRRTQHTHSLSAALHYSPFRPAGLPWTCLHLPEIWCAVSEKQDGRKTRLVLKQLMWNLWSGSPRCPRHWEERNTLKHKETREAFITLIWNVSRLGRAAFAFCHRGRHTHPLCAVTTERRDRRIQVPHKHILLTAGTWSWLSHDSVLTRKSCKQKPEHTTTG